MTVGELKDAMNLQVLAGNEFLSNTVDGCYIGDLLSWVMGRAGEGNVWITVMGNANAVAVAKLVELSCIVLCEDAHLDEEARQQADANGVPVLAGRDNAFQMACGVAKLLGEPS